MTREMPVFVIALNGDSNVGREIRCGGVACHLTEAALVKLGVARVHGVLLEPRGGPVPQQTCLDLCGISYGEAGQAAAANVHNQTNDFI